MFWCQTVEFDVTTIRKMLFQAFSLNFQNQQFFVKNHILVFLPKKEIFAFLLATTVFYKLKSKDLKTNLKYEDHEKMVDI